MIDKHKESSHMDEIPPDASLRFKPRTGDLSGSQEENPDEALAKRKPGETYDSFITDAAKVVDFPDRN